MTDVFCTTLRPVHRRSIEAFSRARWWTSESELETYGRHLEGLLETVSRLSTDQAGAVQADMAMLKRFRPAPDKFLRQVQLYPLPGASPGSAGLLLTPPTTTIVIAGDAAVTADHVRAGQIWHGCGDHQTAMESLRDVLEIADVIVPGHDNVMFTPGRWM